MKRYFIYIAMALLISGCGDGDSSFSDGKVKSTINVGEEVFLGSGDSITPDSSDTEIIVSHYLNNTKSVRVLQGSVTLVSGNYDVK